MAKVTSHPEGVLVEHDWGDVHAVHPSERVHILLSRKDAVELASRLQAAAKPAKQGATEAAG